MTPTRLYLGQFDADNTDVTLCSGLDLATIKSVVLCNADYESAIQFHLWIENPSDPTVEEARLLMVEVPPITTVIENFEIGLPAGWDLKARAMCPADSGLDIRVMIGGVLV